MKVEKKKPGSQAYFSWINSHLCRESIGWTSPGSASRTSRSSIGFGAPAKNSHASCALESVVLAPGPIFPRNHRPSSADPVEWMEQLSQESWVEPISDFRRIATLHVFLPATSPVCGGTSSPLSLSRTQASGSFLAPALTARIWGDPLAKRQASLKDGLGALPHAPFVCGGSGLPPLKTQQPNPPHTCPHVV